MSAEDIREEILLTLAKTPDLTAAEIYDACTLADTQQTVYAQINYLKRNGQIVVSDKDHVPYIYRLAKPLKELVETTATQISEKRETEETTIETISTSPLIEPAPSVVTAVSAVYQIAWSKDVSQHCLRLLLKHGSWYLSARRVVPVTPELLRQMADLIEASA